MRTDRRRRNRKTGRSARRKQAEATAAHVPPWMYAINKKIKQAEKKQ